MNNLNLKEIENSKKIETRKILFKGFLGQYYIFNSFVEIGYFIFDLDYRLNNIFPENYEKLNLYMHNFPGIVDDGEDSDDILEYRFYKALGALFFYEISDIFYTEDDFIKDCKRYSIYGEKVKISYAFIEFAKWINEEQINNV